MKKTQLQNLTEEFAELTWEVLTEVFDVTSKKLPPIYYFLSAKSKGSLKNRSFFEIDLVHRQQFFGEGITLKFPPQAYVSTLEQTPEEATHLFALTHQPSTLKYLKKKQLALERKQELRSTILHEAFGRFGSRLILGKGVPTSRPASMKVNSPEEIWEVAHREGYALGEKLAEFYFSEHIDAKDLRKWFRMNWYSSEASSALKFLYKLTGLKPRF